MKIFFFLLTFLISYTSAAQWVEIQSDTIGGIGGVDLNSIYFLNADTGYVEGRYRQNDEWVNSYFSTLDGGVSWNITTIEGGDGNIGFVNDTIGFVGGYPVQKTIDGGLNWTAYDSIPTGDKIQFVNDSIGYISSASNLYRTNDAGSSWVQIESIPAIFSAYDMHFINANTGYLVGINGYQLKGLISKTTDGGVNWSQQIVGNHPIRGIFFTDINTGYAVGGGSITVPHGQDWESVNTTVCNSSGVLLYCSVQFTPPSVVLK